MPVMLYIDFAHTAYCSPCCNKPCLIFAVYALRHRSKEDYKSLKAWMDTKHPSWVKNCGLVQQTDESSGKLEWRPPKA